MRHNCGAAPPGSRIAGPEPYDASCMHAHQTERNGGTRLDVHPSKLAVLANLAGAAIDVGVGSGVLRVGEHDHDDGRTAQVLRQVLHRVTQEPPVVDAANGRADDDEVRVYVVHPVHDRVSRRCGVDKDGVGIHVLAGSGAARVVRNRGRCRPM